MRADVIRLDWDQLLLIGQGKRGCMKQSRLAIISLTINLARSVVFTFCFLYSRLNENYGLFSNNVSTVGHDNFTLGTRAKG